MPEREGSIEAVVRSFFETLSSGDLDAVGKLLHEQATWTIFAEGLPGAGTHEGREAIVEGFLRPVRGMFEPGDPKVVIENLVAAESWVAVEARGRGRFANGTPYRNTYAFFVEGRETARCGRCASTWTASSRARCSREDRGQVLH